MGYQLELAGPKESVAAFRLTDRSTSEAVIDHTRSEDTAAGTADVRRCHSSKAVGLKGYGCFRKSRTAAPDPLQPFTASSWATAVQRVRSVALGHPADGLGSIAVIGARSLRQREQPEYRAQLT